jgi:hypothetical protein
MPLSFIVAGDRLAVDDAGSWTKPVGERLLTSRRLYIELTVVEIGALEPRWDAVETARARGVGPWAIPQLCAASFRR